MNFINSSVLGPLVYIVSACARIHTQPLFYDLSPLRNVFVTKKRLKILARIRIRQVIEKEKEGRQLKGGLQIDALSVCLSVRLSVFLLFHAAGPLGVT